MKFDKTIYIVVFVFALLVLSGFYFIFEKIGNSKTDLKNLELSVELLEKRTSDIETTRKINNETEKQEINNIPPGDETQKTSETEISATILFEIQSNPILQPQTKITVLVEKAVKASDGKIRIEFKAFTNEATTYSAFEPRDYFEIVNLTGNNQKPLEVRGQFTSIPPKSSTSGEIIFKIEPTANNLILQTGAGDNIKFYEFNFSKKTYKEAVLG